jgi:peptide/nickel transport system ATP-binding protein
MNEPLLAIDDLHVTYRSDSGEFPALRGVCLALGREKLAIVGESGSGKSTIGRSILKLLPRTARIEARMMRFQATDLLAAGERAMQRIRGRHIAMILQDPRYALNPLMPVGDQIAEAFRVHHAGSRAVARRRALDLMRAVRIRDPESVYGRYPHQVSGGMGQRVMIATMLIPDPELLIADEPTSALDVSVRLQVLAILDDLVRERGLGLLLITHDLALAQSFCDRVIVLYRGRIVEELPADRLAEATHPYTRGLLACVPRLDRPHARFEVLDRRAIDAATA